MEKNILNSRNNDEFFLSSAPPPDQKIIKHINLSHPGTFFKQTNLNFRKKILNFMKS